ncbi:hypothetical protein F5X98DRAFT_92640 [Xylaria grammica]|nr:hypothetical protein F5X98DRAFT_92640 [Xylaria grammica]
MYQNKPRPRYSCAWVQLRIPERVLLLFWSCHALPAYGSILPVRWPSHQSLIHHEDDHWATDSQNATKQISSNVEPHFKMSSDSHELISSIAPADLAGFLVQKIDKAIS